MHDYHFDEGVVEGTLRLMIVISLLENEFHFIKASGEIIGYVKHSDPNEVHEEPDMIGIESRKPSLTGEVFHDDFHHGDIFVKEVGERKNHLFFHSCTLV